MGKQRPIDLSGFDEIVKTSKPKELDLSAFDEIVKKKDDLQSVAPTGSEPLPIGSKPFLPQVSTKIPSVLTPKGQVDYQKQVKDYVPPKEVKLPKDETPDFFESVKNSLSNIGTGVQQFIPNTTIALSETLQGLLGKDLGSDFYKNIVGAANNPELDRQVAYAKLAELEPQFKKTRGLIESAEKFDVVGLAAATVDAMSSLVRTAITSVPTAGIGLASDMVGGSIASYNQEKAKSKGISVDELYRRGENEFAIPAAIGAIGTGLEGIGLKGTIGLINKKLTGSIAKKFATTFVDVNKEGLTEFTQTGLDAANNALAQGKSATEATSIAVDEMLSKKGLESYLMGSVGSAGAAGLGRVAKGMLPSNKKTVTEATQKISEMESELSNPNLSPATQEFISQNIRENVSVIADAIESDADKIEGLSDEQKFTINSVNEVINSYEEVLSDPNASEQTKNLAQERIDKLDLEIDNILEGKKVSPETESIIQPIPKPTFDTEEQITKEAQQAEAEFKQTDDLVTYEQKMKELDDRANNLVPAPEQQVEITKPQEDAIQVETAGQVPVQPEAPVSEEVEQGKPEAKPKVVTEEGVKAEEVTPAQQVEQLRADEQAAIKAAISNADQYLTDGKVDRTKITDAKDLKKFDEIYDKYDKLITPLLPKKEAPSSVDILPKYKKKSIAEWFNKGLNATSIFEGGEIHPEDATKRAAWRSMGGIEFSKLLGGEEIGGETKKGGYFGDNPAIASAQKGEGKYLVEFGGKKVEGETTVGKVSSKDVTGVWKYENGSWNKLSKENVEDLIPKEQPKEEAPAKAEPKLKSKVATRLLFKKAVDLFYDISAADGSAKKGRLARDRQKFLAQNPSIKYIDDNWTNISKQLKEKGLLEKLKGCP